MGWQREGKMGVLEPFVPAEQLVKRCGDVEAPLRPVSVLDSWDVNGAGESTTTAPGHVAVLNARPSTT